MTCTDWSKLNIIQLGRYGEYYAMMATLSYGLQEYGINLSAENMKLLDKYRFADAINEFIYV